MCALDRQRDVILVLLDLSAAFDTIDHEILLRRLHLRFGFEGPVLEWLKSYLHGRTQKVSIGTMVSKEHSLRYGVPQGSVLGPILFSLYMVPLEDIITRHDLNTVIFADDTQLYVACDAKTDYSVVRRIEDCVDEIRGWMRDNFLALNDAKTEIMWFSSCFKKVEDLPILKEVRIGDVQIAASTEPVRDLGVMIESSGSMDAHVAKVCKTASYSLWRISKLRNILDQSSTEKLIHAFVTSRIDYCNSVFFGLYDYQFRKLQHIQNSAARLVTRRKLERHIDMTPILRELHWLPVKARVEFKNLCIIFNLIRCGESAPFYLKELIQVHQPTDRNTRSCMSINLVQRNFKPKPSRTYGDRAFSVYAPILWNGLPPSLRNMTTFAPFKSALKTFIFRKYFD
jgi:hypothetical protein